MKALKYWGRMSTAVSVSFLQKQWALNMKRKKWKMAPIDITDSNANYCLQGLHPRCVNIEPRRSSLGLNGPSLKVPGAFIHSHFAIPAGHARFTNASAVSVINETSVMSSKNSGRSWSAPGSSLTGKNSMVGWLIPCKDDYILSRHTLPSTAPVWAMKHAIKTHWSIFVKLSQLSKLQSAYTVT